MRRHDAGDLWHVAGFPMAFDDRDPWTDDRDDDCDGHYDRYADHAAPGFSDTDGRTPGARVARMDCDEKRWS